MVPENGEGVWGVWVEVVGVKSVELREEGVAEVALSRCRMVLRLGR